MAGKKKESGQPQPVIRYAPIGELKVYSVPEHELDQLALGSSSSLFLNFGLFLLPIGLSFIVMLTTTEIKSDRLFSTYVIISTITIIASLVLLALWGQNYRSSRSLLKEIKQRMPSPEPIQQEVLEPPQTPPDPPAS